MMTPWLRALLSLAVSGVDAFLIVPPGLLPHRRTYWSHVETLLRLHGGEAVGEEEDGKYSFVEGTTFDNELSELEAMGGDPFFLDADDNGSLETFDEDEAISEIEDIGGDSSFLCTTNAKVPHAKAGYEDASARFREKAEDLEALGGDPSFLGSGEDLTGEDSNDAEDVADSPSNEFVDDFSHLKGVLDVIGDRKKDPLDMSQGSAVDFAQSDENDSVETAIPSIVSETQPFSGVMETIGDDALAEIEALGGDPFFLDALNENEDHEPALTEDTASHFLTDNASPIADNSVNAIGSGEEPRYITDGKGPSPTESNSDFLLDQPWDGTVDEEAHFDFY